MSVYELSDSQYMKMYDNKQLNCREGDVHMSNTNSNKVIHVGMKDSGKKFVIRESNVDAEKFKLFITDLGNAMENKTKDVSLLDLDNVFLYLNFESVAYVTVTHEAK